ncbi:MAG: hypothetical protein U1E10_03515 [Bdellovibrionales bacterium]|nr:hypothetical protein [Bdellovibrionales bacterium]
MKFFLTVISMVTFSNVAMAADVLNNCFSGKGAQFFASELETIATEKSTPVLLLNKAGEVVGVVSVSPERDAEYPHKANVVAVNKIELCSSLEVDDFYYADDGAANLLDWEKSGSVALTQDEGMIVLSTKLSRQDSYATQYKVEFKAYDVFNEAPEKDKDHPDYIEDWGAPKGSGEFYFFIPANWTK